MGRNSVIKCLPHVWTHHVATIAVLSALSILSSSHIPMISLLALAIADANLLGGWAAAERKINLRRVASASISVCLIGVALTISAALWSDMVALVATFSMLLSSASIVFVILAIATRRYSIVLANTASTVEWRDSRHRFSLAQLLFAVGIVSTLLGLAQLARLWLDGWIQVRVAALIFAPALAISHAGVAWAILAGRSLVVRIVVASMLIPGLGVAARVLASRALRIDELDYIDWFAFVARAFPLVNVVHASMTAIMYVLLRRNGWRFGSFTSARAEQ